MIEAINDNEEFESVPKKEFEELVTDYENQGEEIESLKEEITRLKDEVEFLKELIVEDLEDKSEGDEG